MSSFRIENDGWTPGVDQLPGRVPRGGAADHGVPGSCQGLDGRGQGDRLAGAGQRRHGDHLLAAGGETDPHLALVSSEVVVAGKGGSDQGLIDDADAGIGAAEGAVDEFLLQGDDLRRRVGIGVEGTSPGVDAEDLLAAQQLPYRPFERRTIGALGKLVAELPHRSPGVEVGGNGFEARDGAGEILRPDRPRLTGARLADHRLDAVAIKADGLRPCFPLGQPLVDIDAVLLGLAGPIGSGLSRRAGEPLDLDGRRHRGRCFDGVAAGPARPSAARPGSAATGAPGPSGEPIDADPNAALVSGAIPKRTRPA